MYWNNKESNGALKFVRLAQIYTEKRANMMKRRAFLMSIVHGVLLKLNVDL